MSDVIKAYKGFGKNLQCRGYQYEIGKEYETDKAHTCECGFHACEYPLDIFSYYPPADSRFCEVEQSGKIHKDGEKQSSTKIKIGAELNIAGICKAAIEYTRSKCTNEYNAESGKPATAGEHGAATAGYAGAATSRGKSSTGEHGVCVARGNNVMVKGGLGSLLVIAVENQDDYNINAWKAVVVDGKIVKADTWYQLVDGELKEVTDEKN